MLRVVEFYSGIGGMHYALLDTDVSFEVIAAMEINTTANEVYKFNFPEGNLLQKNIEGWSVEEAEKLDADCYLMSPPCQPFTRQGNQEASNDPRSRSFLNILSVISRMRNPPRYLLVENVKGFENSDTRNSLVSVLKERKYNFQEFLLSPSQFNIPNSRLRYYLCAKLSPLQFSIATSEQVIEVPPAQLLKSDQEKIDSRIGDYISPDVSSDYLLKDKVLTRFNKILDIVNRDSDHSCCFTKAYGHYVEGTGSVFTDCTKDEINKVYSSLDKEGIDEDEKLSLLSSLKLRYFTPQEIARLMSFPKEFDFPPHTTRKQKYRLLGNSVNIFVISRLLKYVLLTELQPT